VALMQIPISIASCYTPVWVCQFISKYFVFSFKLHPLK
jgi:hypothetical protein